VFLKMWSADINSVSSVNGGWRWKFGIS